VPNRFTIEIRFRLNLEKRIEFLQSSESLICCEGDGHIRTTVFEEPDQPGLMVWRSVWSDRDKLNAYLDGARFKVLMGGIRALGTRVRLEVGELPDEKVLPV
jgi:quinol monooxygenase YgiN